jgi:hypothetical protein
MRLLVALADLDSGHDNLLDEGKLNSLDRLAEFTVRVREAE